MSKTSNLYWEKYKRITEDSKLEILDTKFHSETKVGLKKRSGRRVGNNVVSYSVRYPTQILVLDKVSGKQTWVNVLDEGAYKYVTGTYSYNEYKDHQTRNAINGIGCFLIFILSLFAFGLLLNSL